VIVSVLHRYAKLREKVVGKRRPPLKRSLSECYSLFSVRSGRTSAGISLGRTVCQSWHRHFMEAAVIGSGPNERIGHTGDSRHLDPFTFRLLSVTVVLPANFFSVSGMSTPPKGAKRHA
jgi:hypothetical protein